MRSRHERLQAALRDLGLIRRVSGVPAGIFEDVSLNDRRREGVMIPEADEGAQQLVPAHDLAHAAQRLLLAQRWRQSQGFAHSDAFRHHLVDQIIKRFETKRLQHALRLSGGGANVTAREICGHLGERMEVLRLASRRPVSLAKPVPEFFL
jgi:hypothetical protein